MENILTPILVVGTLIVVVIPACLAVVLIHHGIREHSRKQVMVGSVILVLNCNQDKDHGSDHHSRKQVMVGSVILVLIAILAILGLLEEAELVDVEAVLSFEHIRWIG